LLPAPGRKKSLWEKLHMPGAESVNAKLSSSASASVSRVSETALVPSKVPLPLVRSNVHDPRVHACSTVPFTVRAVLPVVDAARAPGLAARSSASAEEDVDRMRRFMTFLRRCSGRERPTGPPPARGRRREHRRTSY